MRSGFRTIMILLMACLPCWVSADQLIVIVHQDSNYAKLNKKEIKRIFMEPYRSSKLIPINLPKNSKPRVVFNTKIIGLPEVRISSYWAQMKFSGRGTPPIELPNEQAILEYIKNNRDYIGYVTEQSPLPDGTKAVLTIQY